MKTANMEAWNYKIEQNYCLISSNFVQFLTQKEDIEGLHSKGRLLALPIYKILGYKWVAVSNLTVANNSLQL
jgi:hypothetical protein